MNARVGVIFSFGLFGLFGIACSDDAVPDDDFAGFISTDFAALDATDNADATPPGPDLEGYDVSCDPNAALSGGDPTGHWQVYTACASADALFQLQANCPAIAIDGIAVRATNGVGNASGSLDLNQDGTFSRTSHGVLAATATVPTSCTQAFGGCVQYGMGEDTQFDWLTIACHQDTTACTCAITVDVSETESGTWSATTAGFTTNTMLGGPQPFDSSATPMVLRARGDDTSVRGNRGITYVLVR